MAPVNKDVTTKSTTMARVTATSGPAAQAAELRKSKRKKAGKENELTTYKTSLKEHTGLGTTNEISSEAQPPTTRFHQETQESDLDHSLAVPAAETANETTSNVLEPSLVLHPIPMPSFLEESLAILPAYPSPNISTNGSQINLLTAFQNEAVSSTPIANSITNASNIMSHPSMMIGSNQAFATQAQSAKERLMDAEGQRDTLGNNGTNTRIPLDKYTKAEMPPIHYAHPTTIFDHLDVNLVDDWEKLPKGKLLAQPFGPVARDAGKHPLLKSLLFAAIFEITNSHDVSVSAPRPKPNSYRTPFSFLIYNVTEQQAQTLLERRVWSSSAITFSISTFNPGCPEYLFSIKGLTTMASGEVFKTVNEVWRNQDSLTFLQALCHNLPENLQEQAIVTLQYFVNSLQVRKLDTKLPGNAIAPIFNIYANGSLISNDNTWSKIRAYYASRTYAPQAQDPGVTIVAPFRCSICHAADHPRGLCPFPIIEGWNGPKRREDPTTLGGSGGGPGSGPDPRMARKSLP